MGRNIAKADAFSSMIIFSCRIAHGNRCSRSGPAYILVALPWGLIAYVLMTSKLSGAGFGITGERKHHSSDIFIHIFECTLDLYKAVGFSD